MAADFPRENVACAGVLDGGGAIAAFAGDALTLTGLGWDPLDVQVRAGTVTLPQSAPATDTTLGVRMPASLAPRPARPRPF